MRRIVVPPAPGLFSSFGLLYADVEHHYVRTWRKLVREADPAGLGDLLRRMEAGARAQLAGEGFPDDRVRLRRSADCRYQGQSFELTVPVADGPIDAGTLAALAEAFGQRARAHVRAPRRGRGARRDREPARGRPRRLRSSSRAGDDPHRPARRGRPTHAARVLRPPASAGERRRSSTARRSPRPAWARASSRSTTRRVWCRRARARRWTRYGNIAIELGQEI